MAVRRVNPNRMELMRLKNQLNTARRGHKLLKDKRDEMMRQFMALLKDTASLRKKVEDALKRANEGMMLAKAVLPEAVINTALMSGEDNLEVEVERYNIMSVDTPEFSLPESAQDAESLYLPYSLVGGAAEVDRAILSLQAIFPELIRLATMEKRTELLAVEIEKTRRRVNSLEYRMIPDLEETIRSITMKMEENERANLTRLMKVKELILEADIQERQSRRDA